MARIGAGSVIPVKKIGLIPIGMICTVWVVEFIFRLDAELRHIKLFVHVTSLVGSLLRQGIISVSVYPPAIPAMIDTPVRRIQSNRNLNAEGIDLQSLALCARCTRCTLDASLSQQSVGCTHE